MVRETRHLWVGNLPDNIREDRIREHFKRYGRVQNVKLLGRAESASAGIGGTGASGVCATVAFMDIKSASKAHNGEHVLDERTLTTEYYEPAAIPPAAGAPSAGSSPAGSGYSGSSSSVNSVPVPSSASRYHLSGGEDSSGATTCPIAASAAAPAAWRGTNDSATEYSRRGNTPAAYGRYQRNNSTAPYSTPPSNLDRTTPHHRWYATGAGGESTPSTPGGGTESGRRRRHSGSASSRSDSSSPEPSDTSRASTPATQPTLSHHNNHRTPSSNTSHQWASTANGRPLSICVRNLPTRSTDSSLKDGLYHEYKKHGKVVWVKVVGQNADRYAVVRFKKPSDVEKALEVSQDKLFFGCKISVAPHQSCDDEAEATKPYETDIDEYHPKATRTLFIGNLEKDVTQQQLRDKFKHFGRIIEIDIKKGSGGGAGYAFCQYASISSVVEAIRAMDGEYVGGSRVKLGFGKPVATACVWVDGLTEHTEKQDAFYEQLEKHGGSAALAGSERLSGDLSARYVPSTRHDSIRFEGCGSRSRASSYGRSSSRTPRYSALEHYDPVDYAADRRYRVYDETGASSPLEEGPFEDRLQSVVVSPHRARRHRRDSSPEDRKHSKERRRSAGGGVPRRSRSGSTGRERHTARRKHRRRHDGSGSRAGTPLRDEPDAPPAEPRRPPRDRPPLPMCLPLPKFAAQLLRAAPPAPRPVPQPAPAPDSPPRPPSVSSSSGGSAPHSPSLEERIRSLDEKYEKWSGSRALADAPDRARLRHRLLEVDINEVKPSEVVSALLAKRSVFDEDSERLECVVRPPSPSEARVRGVASRLSRYPPLPVHSSSGTAAHHPPPEVDVSDRPSDPRLNRPERPCRLEKLGKINESDYGECRGRPRTPSTDRSQPDFCDRRTSPAHVDGDAESRSRDSATGTCDAESKSSFDTDDKELELGIKRERSNSSTSDSLLTGKCESLSTIPILENLSDRIDENIKSESQIFQLEQKCARDVIDMLLKKVEHEQKLEPELDNSCKINNKHVSDDNEHDFLKQDRPSPLFDGDTKNAILYENTKKSENNKIEIFPNTDSAEFDLQLHHKNSSSFSKSIKEKDAINYEINKYGDKTDKDRFNHNISQVYQITKLEKENIQSEKHPENETHVNLLVEKKLLETDKNSEDRAVRNDRDKVKHKDRMVKEKHDFEKEKLKINRIEKYIDRSDKKIKGDNLPAERNPFDKGDKSKGEKDTEKHHKDKTETEKLKHFDDKARSDQIKKEKFEKDKKKEVDIVDTAHTKSKKDDRHKTDKFKKEVDSKREIKKESEPVKSRKSSRDESSREIYRKDSTDSSTSRASHESAKSRDIDKHDIKEDMKPKVKLTDLFIKLERNKETLLKDVKLEPSIKIKTEIKEEKNTLSSLKMHDISEHIKPKAEVIEKHRHHSLDSPSVDSKRKERFNSCSSLPPNIGHKRRISSHDSFDSVSDDVKRNKNDLKLPERRDSKDSRNADKHKTTKFSKGHFVKIIESKTKDDKKDQVKRTDELVMESTENNETNNPNPKSVKRSPKEEKSGSTSNEHAEEAHNNLDFLALFELRSSEEDERQKALRKEMKEKKRIQQLQQIQELQMQQDAMQQGELMGKLKDDKKFKPDDKRKEAAREKRFSIDRKSREEKNDNCKRKNRKQLHSSDTSDSDEPKKHSIFDIIDDGPTYISMYDKVKARSCKNMQKQEEEKRQEKIKAKFSQLKQSRAKREEKKRSSWDEDSDSEQEGHRKQQKSSPDNSSDDESMTSNSKKHDKLHQSNIEFDENKTEDYFSTPNDEDLRNKLARKNSRTRIISDSSDADTSKSKSPNYRNEAKKFNASDSESLTANKSNDSKDINSQTKKNSLLNLFGKSDSDDSKFKSNIGNDDSFKLSSYKAVCNDLSSESESVTSNRNCAEFRRKHKKKPKKHKSSYSDEENKINHSDGCLADSEIRPKISEKQRRHSNKKDKRKEKIRDSIDTDEGRDDKVKLRREKKSPDNLMGFECVNDTIANNIKRDGKMEDIFGPLSDESDKDPSEHQNKTDFSSLEIDSFKDRLINSLELKFKDKEDIRRRKDKKRKEKRWLREDENSLDVDAVSKAIEARLFAESLTDDDNRVRMVAPEENLRTEINDNKCMDSNAINEVVKLNSKHDKLRRDSREKKKKKKRNKEDRQYRKDTFYHIESFEQADKNVTEKPILDTETNTMLLDIPLPNDSQTIELKTADEKSLSESPSLPRLTASPPNMIETFHDVDTKIATPSAPGNIVGDDDDNMYNIESQDIKIEQIPMPPPFENIVEDLSEVPLPEDPEPTNLNKTKSDNFISTLSSDSDLSEDAIRSICETETDKDKVVELNATEDKVIEKIEIPSPKIDKKSEEKPRAIISQEETEDAVAALLGESFGGKINTFSNYEESENDAALQNDVENTPPGSENIPEEDAEEMRQAVQNLNACEMELKPDTPVSDNDLLLIDTDTEEPDDPPQEVAKVPVNVVTAVVPSTNNTAQKKAVEEPLIQTSISKSSIESPLTKSHSLETDTKTNETDVKFILPRRENIQIMTSTATPVITSWTLTNNKLLEPHVINIQPNMSNRDKNETKPAHITTNIVQIKTSQTQNAQVNNIAKPVLTPSRVNAPYQVISQMVRPNLSNMQPPTIKIPEPHILYQKSQGIVISPRMPNDPRIQSPIASPQGDAMTSPRLSSVPGLSSSQNLNSTGMVSPNSIHQRSPGQVTVVRVQQPPLSPIQAMHLPPGTRTMVSPSRPNSVLVQTQGSPLHHHNRLPITPLLTPLPKQINVNTILQQNKSVGVNCPLLPQQKVISGDVRKNETKNILENKNDTAKIILSPTHLQHSTNPTVMAQNRLISMQNAVHIGNINSPIHLNNKFVINKMSATNDQRESTNQKMSEHGGLPFVSSPLIHVAGVNHSAPTIIQSSMKSVVCNLQESSNVVRGQSSNVIHSLNSQRLLTPASISNVRQLDINKVAPSVLSLANIRSPTVLTKIESSIVTTATTANVTSVTPILIKSGATIGTLRINTKPEKDAVQIHANVQKESKSDEKTDKELSQVNESDPLRQNIFALKPFLNPTEGNKSSKSETDFEELLKDNTNKIIVTKDPDAKLAVNVGKATTTLIKPSLQNSDKQHLNNTECGFQKKELEPSVSEQSALPTLSSNKNCANKSEDSNRKDTSEDIISKETPKDIIPTSHVDTISKSNISLDLTEEKKITPNSEPYKTSETLLNKAYENISIDKEEISLDFVKEKQIERQATEETNKQIENIENELKTLDENDSWSAKDLNIESVIKKVDSLCNDSVDTFQTSQETKSFESSQEATPVPNSVKETKNHDPHLDNIGTDNIDSSSQNIINDSNITSFVSTGKRGGRSIRGRKSEKNQDRVQTRQIAKTPRGATAAKRGRGRAKVDKKVKNLVSANLNTMPGDVYDFHEDSGDEGSSNKSEPRPRLILTIKSPLSGQAGVTATSTLSINQNKLEERRASREEKPEDFASPSLNTRKSRRLQEKDVHRTVADDIGEDGVRNARSAKRRPTRQAAVGKSPQVQEKSLTIDTRKSPRGTKRIRDRSLSDASVDSGDGDGRKDEIPREAKAPRLEDAVAPVRDGELPPPALRAAVSTVPRVDPPPQITASSAPSAASHVITAPVIASHVLTSHVITSHVITSHVTSTAVPLASSNQRTSVAPGPDRPALVGPVAFGPAVITSSLVTPVTCTVSTVVPPLAVNPPAQSFAPPVTPAVASVAAPPAAPTCAPIPITKPPKKMISEMSAKLAGAFDTIVQHRPEAECARDPPPAAPATGEAQAGDARRAGEVAPCAMLPVGATAAADFRVRSPALPHRPPPAPAHRASLDRVTPLLIRGGEGAASGMGGAGVGAGAGAVRLRALVAGGGGAASLPRGAHHPPHPPPDPPAPHAKPLPVAVVPPHHHHQPHHLPHHHHPAASRITSVPSVSPQGQMPLGDGMYPHFSQQHFQMYQQHFRATQHESRATPSPFTRIEAEGSEAPTSPLELRRLSARVPRPAHSPSPAPPDRHIMYAVKCGRSPPPAHGGAGAGFRGAGAASAPPGPPHASQVPHEADSLQMLLRRYPVMWQGLLALKNDSAAVQMHFVGGNPRVAGETLARAPDLAPPLLRIAQRMRLEPAQLDQVHRKMKLENEHCILLALPCGRDHMDVLQQSTNLTAGFITYLQRKGAAGIVNIAPPGHHQAMFTVHIFPSCEFANENLSRIAPDLMHRVTDIAHLLIVIATV